jgi:hypothetical protein
MFGSIEQRVKWNAQNLNDMMAHVGLDRETAPKIENAFATAMRRCLWCSASAKCRQWLDAVSGHDRTAPAFCPNAFFAKNGAVAIGAAAKAAVLTRGPAEGADDALLSICHEWGSAAAENDSSTLALDAAEERFDEIDPPPPEALFEQAGDRTLRLPTARRHHSGRLWYVPVIATMRDLLGQSGAVAASPVVPETTARVLEILAAHDTWHAARTTAEEISGVRAAAARDKALSERVRVLLERIASTPAPTLAGLRHKAIAAVWSAGGIGPLEVGLGETGQVDVALAISLVRDLLALDEAECR